MTTPQIIRNALPVVDTIHLLATAMRKRNPHITVAEMKRVLVKMNFNVNTVSTQLSVYIPQNQ